MLGKCAICNRTSITISNSIGVCVDCLRRDIKSLDVALKPHVKWREEAGLPPTPPKRREGVKCRLCVNECVLSNGEVGFCGIIFNNSGKLQHRIAPNKALVYTYLDPLPTNCVATPVCPAATSEGYPKYTKIKGVEHGYYNLAVFFAGCNLDCLFCQNWEHKIVLSNISRSYRGDLLNVMDSEEMVRRALNHKVTCICYFGGDPGPHASYALAVSRAVINEAKKKGLIKRICWETNGIENPIVMRHMAKLSLISGGIVKIDWKAWTPQVYQALTGVNGWKAIGRIKENVKNVYNIGRDRCSPPLLVVSTLLVPGYVDADEVHNIAKYLSQISEEIPLILLAFHPDFRMRDLPPTSLKHAEEALRAARSAGLKRVFIGNYWLLGRYY